MSCQVPKSTSPASPSTEPSPSSHSSQFQYPSGSRSTEPTASTVISETANGALSLDPSIQNTPHWWNLNKQRVWFQNIFCRTTAPPSHIGPGESGAEDSYSGVTGSSSAMAKSSVQGSTIASAPLPTPSVSFSPASHPANSFPKGAGLWFQSTQNPPLFFLRSVASDMSSPVEEVLRTSFSDNPDLMRDIIPKRNGFVFTALEAYNNHRKLIIRPDDVWLSIMTQFSFFINGNSESLRKMFVAHEGKRELVVHSVGNRFSMDTPFLIKQMMALMEENITDPSLREWIVPDFTTTKDVDRTTCAVVMMGMMKNYFTYKICLMCGIPEVTLEGEKQDWESILTRIERLQKYGIQTTAWYHLLRPIITRFIQAYDEPDHADNLEFWNRIAHYEPYGSGSSMLLGWITAFCVFDERGRWQGNKLNEDLVQEHDPEKPADVLQLTPSQFAAVYMKQDYRSGAPYLALDGFPYPKIDSGDIPCGYVEVDVQLDDNGHAMETMFIAGSVGLQICSMEKTKSSPNGLRDTVRPVTGWWLVVKPGEGKKPQAMFE